MSLSPQRIQDVVKDLGRGLKAIKDRQPEYDRREEYYQGRRSEVITHPKLAKLLDRYGESFGLNYAAVPCDALMDRLDLMSLTTQDEGVDRLLKDRLWIPNDLDDDADDIHLHAAYLGDYYLVAEYIADDADQADDQDETGTGVGTIELTPKHPERMAVLYQRSNSRVPDFAVQMIPGAAKGEWEAIVYYDDLTYTFSAEEAGEGWNPDDYAVDLDNEGEADVVANEFGFPVFHFRPDAKPYGKPVNSKVYGPQDAITKINATQMASLDYYGFPQRYATMDPAAEQDDDIDDDFNDDGLFGGDDSPNGGAAQGRSKLSSDPGGAWLLKGVRSVGQFQASDPEGFLKQLAFQIRAAATLSRTPLYEFDLEGTGDQPSGEARRRADGPITKHAAKIKGQFGSVWSAVGAFSLRALGVDTTKTVEAVWAPSETATDKEGIETIALKIENGVPPRQALLEAGYTNEQVEQFLPVDEVNGLKMPLSIGAIGDLAASLREVGNAKQLGSVSDDQIRRLFRAYFGDTAGFEPGSGVTEEEEESSVQDAGVTAATILKAKADAMGVLIRAGVDQDDAARQVGLDGLDFTSIPVAVRVPSSEASQYADTKIGS